MNQTNHPSYTFDGRCTHCGDKCTTSGCMRCTSIRTFCSCGALLFCGCGNSYKHEHCPNVIQTSFMTITSKYEIIPNLAAQKFEDPYEFYYGMKTPSTSAPPATHFPLQLVMPDFDQQRLSWPQQSTPVYSF